MDRKPLTPQQQFIVDLYPAAVTVSRETGASWELILAQAAQETGWGKRVLPGTHNIFNIKASPDWHGDSRTFNVPEVENGRTVWKDQRFRVYGSAQEALRDRVAFLDANPRYAAAGLFKQGIRGDLEGEARALQRAGYATDPEYADKMIRVFRGRTMQSAISVARENSPLLANELPARPATPRADGAHAPAPASPNAAIYNEAYLHFIAPGNTFEYGRGDSRTRNREGTGLTDPSRNEVDADGDGLKGVDCSSFVWRGLKDAGFDVPPNNSRQPFTTNTLFRGHQITEFSKSHFEVIPGDSAGARNGPLHVGDVLCFQKIGGSGQHVAIFSGYDKAGAPHFIGSQTQTGPAAGSAAPGTYWNGGQFQIVAALRAKPAFQVRDPLHSRAGEAPASPALQRPTAPPRHDLANTALQPGQSGPAVAHLQRRLFELGYHNEHGKPLCVTGNFGSETLFALRQFQREHGLQGKGVAGPKTSIALERAERALVSHPSHPQHPLYEQALDRLHAAEKARGIASGPHSERVAAALVVECVRKGITRIDRVDIGNGVVQAVQHRSGPPESGLGNTDAISLARSSTQTLGESSRQCHEVAIDAAARRAAPMQERVQSPAPAMTLAR